MRRRRTKNHDALLCAGCRASGIQLPLPHSAAANPRSLSNASQPVSGYTLRVPVRTLGDKPVTGIDTPLSLTVGDRVARLHADPPRLVISIDGFQTEAEAKGYLPRVIAGLWGLVVKHNIAFRSNLVVQAVSYPPDPVAAGNNIARTFGEESGPPVDGIAGVDDVVVFPTGARMRYIGGGDARGSVSSAVHVVVPTLVQGTSHPAPEEVTSDKRFGLALELFNAHFYESSLCAKFLTLVTILEVLAPEMKKHAAAQELMDEWNAALKERIALERDEEALFAFNCLKSELFFRRETSILRRIRALVRQEFGHLPATRWEELERYAVEAYNARSKLQHTGALDPNDLSELHARALDIVRQLLASRLRITL